MKKHAFVIGLCLVITFLVNAISAQEQSFELSSSDKKLIQDSCFEIVVLKPVKDSLTYEKPLPWDLIPYNIRVDKYYSIGTAFAVSEKELVTAYHVLKLDQDSLVYNRFFIRDKEQNVFELDNILLMDNDRDFVKFTVKDKTFKSWLPIKKTYELNTTVFSAGNAYGEGIVIRKGDLIGTIPENENGAWVYLKASSDVNMGNSGGPLLNAQCEVIGIIVSKKDNISYSLPINEMLNGNPAKGKIHSKTFYGFTLIQGRKDVVTYDNEIALPRDYKSVVHELSLKAHSFYVKTMDDMFSSLKEDMFPNGEKSLESLYGVTNRVFPQVVYKDDDSKKWYISDLKTSSWELENNGKLTKADIARGLFLIDLQKPDNISLKELFASPRRGFDMIFQGINIPRKFSGQEIRILSLGDPIKTSSHTDRYNRDWNISIFNIEYSDEVFISFSLPTPKGQIFLIKAASSSQMNIWLYDLKTMTDFVYVSYYGKVKDWKEFLTLSDLLNERIKNIKVTYKVGEQLDVVTPSCSLTIPHEIIPIADDTELVFNFSIYPNKGDIVWDMRRIIVSEYNKDNYFSFFRHIKPDNRLPEDYQKGWGDLVSAKHPYNTVPYTENGRTNIATIISGKENVTASVADKNNFIYTLYLGYEGSIESAKMEKNLRSLGSNIKIND